MLRAIKKTRRKQDQERNGIVLKGPLTADEINEARTLWILSVQGDVCASDLKAILNKDAHPPAYVDQFQLFQDDDGVLRCRGRVDNSSLVYTTKSPALLPAKHRLLLLIIRNSHSKTMRSGVQGTLTHLRESYWIPRRRNQLNISSDTVSFVADTLARQIP